MERVNETRAAAQKRSKGFLAYLKDNPARTKWAALFLAIAAWGSLMNHLDRVISAREPWYFLSSVIRDIGPELAGIVIGVLVIDYLNGQRQDEQLKAQLILQMGSSHNEVVDTAVRTLRAYGWLTDGTLKGAFLYKANLGGASLQHARLEQANLFLAKLQRANMSFAILVGANLSHADLGNASLNDAVLDEADLAHANLSEVSMESASLRGASLSHSSVQNTNLRRANLSQALLNGADLSRSDLTYADLRGAYAASANFAGARLVAANLTGADIMGVDLSDAELGLADLSGTDLTFAKLVGARFQGANLYGVKFGPVDENEVFYADELRRQDPDYIPLWTLIRLHEVASLEGATMPDGVKLRGRDNPDGPDFREWALDWVTSPLSHSTDWKTLSADLTRVLAEEEE